MCWSGHAHKLMSYLGGGRGGEQTKPQGYGGFVLSLAGSHDRRQEQLNVVLQEKGFSFREG